MTPTPVQQFFMDLVQSNLHGQYGHFKRHRRRPIPRPVKIDSRPESRLDRSVSTERGPAIVGSRVEAVKFGQNRIPGENKKGGKFGNFITYLRGGRSPH